MNTNQISVAVLGTGIMGAAMARNLAGAGLEVRAWNRTRSKAEPLATDGVRVVDTPAQAVDGADIVLTMLYDSAATLESMHQAAPGFRAGTVWMQSTTTGLEAIGPLSDLAAENGLIFVDAPVLGTKGPAEAGQLTVLAAGSEDSREILAPVLDAVGQRTIWVSEDGASGEATKLKLVCNSWVLALTNAVGEAIALSQGLGVDPQQLLDAVAGGPVDNGYLRAKATAILIGNLEANFAVSTAEKDARLIVAAGEQAGVRMDVAAASAERFRRAAETGHADEDMAAAYFASFEDGKPPAN